MRVRARLSFVAILALTIGLWGIGSLLVSLHILGNDLNENFLRTDPLHVAMVSDDFERLNLDDLRARPEIAAAEFRDKATLRIEVKPDKWIPLKLNAVGDFEDLQSARFFAETGAFPPPKGTMLIERNALLISDLSIDNKARVQSGGAVFSVPVSGIAFDPGQAPATQDAIVYGYTDLKNFEELSGQETLRRIIIRFANVENRDDVRAATDELTTSLLAQGITVKGLKIPKFNEHPHQFQLRTLLYINGIIGALAFVMAMVLVSQLMSSIMTRQIRQIGIMKAIGGTRGHIFKTYAAYILFLSLASIMIGLPAAVGTGKVYAGFVAGILNFDILTTQLPYQIFVMILLIGVILPILFSLPALRRGMKLSVKEALGDYGISVSEDSKTEKKGFVGGSPLFSLAIRNLGRRKSRMLVTMATMMLGVAIFLTGFNVRESLRVFLDDTSQSMKYDIRVVLKEALPPEEAMAPFAKLAGIKAIEGWVGGVGRIQSEAVSTANGIGLVAAPFDSKMRDREMRDGTWLSGGSEFEFAVNQLAAEKFKPAQIGKHYMINLEGREISARLVGVVREFDVAKIYVDLAQYNRLVNPQGEINSLMISLENRSFDNVMTTKRQVEQIIESERIDVSFVMSQAERAKIIFEHLNIILSVILLLSFLVLAVSALGMGSAMGINVMERTREIGVLRAIGATPKVITRLFVIEGFVIAALSVVAGLVMALPMSVYAAKFFGILILGEETPLDFAFSGEGFTITLAVTLAFGYLASRAPAKYATRIAVREAIAYE